MAKKNIRESKKVMSKNNGLKMRAQDLFNKGSEAQASFDYPTAIDFYSQVLAGGEIPLETEYEVLDLRAECYQRLGNYTAELGDLEKMVEVAQVMDDPEKQIAVVFRQVYTAFRLGENAKVKEIAEAAIALAEGMDELAIKAAAIQAMGYHYLVIEDTTNAQSNFEQALRMYREVGDQAGEARCLADLSGVYRNLGNQVLAEKFALDALEITRKLGERKEEARTLNAWAMATSDYARQREAKEKALEIFQAIRDRWGQGQMYNNLSLLYGDLGLYSTARDYAEKAVEMARDMGARFGLALYLDSLARAELNLGNYEKSKKTFKEGRILSREIQSRNTEGFVLLGMGRVAFASGNAEEARGLIQETLDIFRETNLASDIPTALAWLGAAYLALDDAKSARRYTSEAVTEREAIGLGGSEYPPQEIWWWHYLALTHEIRQEQAQIGSEFLDIPESAWSALQKAREITFEGIASLSDEGLRRNYLNKVEINRQIMTEWARQVAARDLEIDVEESPPGNVQAQLKRLLAIGVRMNERRDVEALTDLIMEELIELSGAERAMLVLVNESGEKFVAASYGFLDQDKDEFLNQASSLLQSVETARVHVLRQDVHQADINAASEDAFRALSVLCIPLLSKGRLSGFIYADNHAIFGKFTQADVDLLGSFTNQVAAAIENAQLYQGLEQRVIERTAELSASNEALEQRNAELAVINSVQDGLAAQLDFDAIIELVGEKIRKVFDAQGIGIAVYDRRTNIVSSPYFIDDNQRIKLDPIPSPVGFTAHIIQTSQPLLVNQNLIQKMEELGSKWVGGDEEETRFSKSYLGVPIIIAGEVTGVISLTNYERENAYSESDVNLLTTLASSMSVALENARLFDETNRLLNETNQRAAELAIINSVQEALASKLEFQSVIDFVGDKLQEVLGTTNIDIRLIDKNNDLVHYLYMIEHGERFNFPPAPISGISKHMLETMEPLVINEDLQTKIKEIGSYTLPGTDTAKSLIAVPFVIREDAIGTIIVEDYDKEHAFSDSDLNLLTTLAASMSVALENARLFDETNRLLNETQQRSAELAIINSVQEGLAEELDIPSIFELVGEKIREIFDAQVVLISTFDHESKTRTFPYLYEKGRQFHSEPGPFNELSRKLIHSRKPIVINEDMGVRAEELGLEISSGTEPVKSLVFVPMIIGDSVMGSVSLQNIDRENAFPESAVSLLITLTSSMSVALENARLFDETNRLLDETQQRNAELTILNSVGDAMAQKQDVNTITRIVGDKVRDIFKADSIEILLYDSQNQIITIPYHQYDRGNNDIPSFQYGEGLTSIVIETRQPLIFGTSEESNKSGAIRILNTEDEKEIESYIGVPIIIGERVLGVVSVQSYSKHAYDESSVRLLSTLAASMGVAIENARLFEETNRLLVESQQQAAEMVTVNTVGQALTSELEMEALIDLIGEQVRQIFSADITYVALHDQQTDLIEFPYAVGEDLVSLPYGEGLTSKIIESAEPLLINEEVNERVDEIGATHTGLDVQSYLGVPIMVGKQAIGVISVQSMKEVVHFDENDVRLLSTIAANVGAALRNAQLYQETQQRADEMAALTEIGREISATLDLENVLERIATRAQDLLNARTATIRLVQEDGSMPTVVAIGKYAEKHRGTMIQMGEGITGNVAKEGKAEIINDPRDDPRIVHLPGTPEEEDEFEAIIFAPLMIGERVIGVMGLWRDKTVAGPFTQDDLNFFESLARQAANAIENARLFEEVQRQKQYSEALVKNSPVAIVTHDLDNNVVSWNPAAESLFGYREDEAIGVNTLDLISSESINEEMANNFKKGADGGRVKSVTQRYRKDGSPVDVELLSLPVVMEGKQVGLVSIYHDITELLEARHEAEAANEAKSAFLATMSHEIRTPMNGVIGMTSLLLDTDLDPEQRDYTETIRNSGEALLTVINDILDFSKIEAGKMELEEQPFDLRDCLESTLDLLKFNASDKGVELAYQMYSDVPAVIVGDITRLRQVLINLLNNGLKFTEKGEVVLSVSTEAIPIKPDGPYMLHFSVCDTGIGIPPERVDRLFQAFSQVDASTSRKYGGTGLGLAISMRLSELMGGEMWVESIEGEGTTFHFTINAQAGPDLKDRNDLKGEQPNLVGKRLLIVDDNLTNRRILTIQTRAWGMLPRDTSDPQEALEWIRQGDPFDLAILDYHMPEMDGIELSKAIRKSADFPLVLFSSISAREIALEEEQFTAFLMKPLKPSVLLDTLMNLFSGDVKRIEPEDGSSQVGLDPQMAEQLPLRILLVEDNAVNQKLALRLLDQMGYRADLAGNGLEAIQAVARQKYDVVLMDVQMPEMDGLEASRRICARWPRGQRPHIVAMTANAMQGDRERCLEAGMDDYVSKPIRVNELVTALGKAKPLGIPGEEMV